MARILIVDDDEILCDLVMELLECDEHLVSAVHHGDDALSAVLASGPELLILDQTLPGPSGLDILAKLRALPQMNDVPVMMLTGSRDAALLVRAAVGGVDDYLAKPFEPTEFMDRARAMLKGGRPGAQSAGVGAGPIDLSVVVRLTPGNAEPNTVMIDAT